MIGIDLFAGAGGMSLGAKAAGINVVSAIEVERNASRTYRANHPSASLIEADIRNPVRWPAMDRREGLVVFGGPPCQGFSTSNQRTRRVSNRNNWLFLEFLRIVRELAPEWVVLENVSGLLQTARGLFLSEIITGLVTLGYSVAYHVLSAEHFGVPQRRARLFIVAGRDVGTPELPRNLVSQPITVSEALADLPELENGADVCTLQYGSVPPSAYAASLRNPRSCGNHLVTRNHPAIIARYRHVPPGGNWRDIPCNLMDSYADPRRCHTGIYHRLRNDQPASVVGNFRKNMLIHPSSDRGISVREAARLQSFPDSYVFTGSIGFQQQQVGNAVPPRLAEAVFRAILRQH